MFILGSSFRWVSQPSMQVLKRGLCADSAVKFHKVEPHSLYAVE